MLRANLRSSGRRPRRLIGIESLEPRAMMSGTQVIQVHLPPAPAQFAGLVGTTNVVSVKTPASAITTTRLTSGPYTPADIRSIYGFNKLSYDGTGITIAIIDAYNDPTIAADLHKFDVQFGLRDPSLTIAQQYNGNSPPAVNAKWETETALDVEWAHAIAPGANILLCEANTNSLDNLMSMVDYARNFSGVSVVSMSFGTTEVGPSRWFSTSQSDLDNILTTPSGHRPVTFVASSGDTGFLTDGAAGTQYPASSPNVLAVGGSSLFANLTVAQTKALAGTAAAPPAATFAPSELGAMSYNSESAWSGSGGGFSAYEGRPSYQNGFQNSTSRAVPDVAYNADPNTPVWMFCTSDGGWEQMGGTSAGAPQWAALVALANQGRAQLGGDTLAYTVSDIYRLPATDFHDITSGSNGFFRATAGYDEVTGRGSPIANLVINDLIHIEGGINTGGTFHPIVPPINMPVASAAAAPLVVKSGTKINTGVATKVAPATAGLRQAFLLAEAEIMSPATHDTARHSRTAFDVVDQLADELFAAIQGGGW